MNCDDIITTLPPVNESTQRVLCELVQHQPLTGKQLREATGLARRTTYAALQKLRQLGLLKERLSLRDTRQTYYWVDAPLAKANAV